MNFWLVEEIAREHQADLRREAAAYRRVVSRAGRAEPGVARRVASGLRHMATHRAPAPVGCEA